jgi:hypothetical protein
VTFEAYIDNIRANAGKTPENFRDLAAAWAMAMAALFVMLLVALHIVRADLDPSWHMISEYAIGPMGWLMRAAFLALAVALLALAAALIPGARGWLAITGVVLLGIGAVGAAMGGLFAMDPVGTPMEQGTRSGMLHGVSFMIGVPGTVLGLTLLSAHLWRRPGWSSGRSLLLATVGWVWLTLIVFAVSMLTLMSKGASGPEFLVGWQNRALVLAWAVWILAVGWRTRSRQGLDEH